MCIRDRSNRFDPMSFVVPSGNFGNAYAGYISKKMGLPIKKIKEYLELQK